MLSKILENISNATTNVQPITGMDATFLYTETATSPMHVGSVVVIEGSLEFETFRKTVKSRIHLVPKLRQRLVEVPMSIDYPYWVDDPHFDIDMHINHIALPKPGSWKELRATASHIFSQALDKSRPLWSFTFVEGLDNISQVPTGSVAVISKIHHVAIDGVAGAGILALLFDMSPKVREIKEPKPFYPAPIPDQLSMVVKSGISFAKNPLKFPKLVTSALASTLKAGAITRVQKMDLPTAPFTAPKTPLNGIISPRRKWNSAILDLKRVKALKNIMGTTLNDVILAFCAGALRRYLDEKNKLPNKPLVAMVPISTRTKAETGGGQTGNQISSMLVQLATNIADPIERLEVIHENTSRGKTYQGAIGAKTLANMAEAVPFGIANQAAQLYTRFEVAKMHNPVFNVTITNVPGPPFPLYIHGHKLLSVMGMAPIIDGMGLIITIFSYDGRLMISSTAASNTLPDMGTFTRYLRESANELEAAILGRKDEKQKKIEKAEAATPKSDKFFLNIKEFLKENPDAVPPKSGLFHFKITGTPSADWRMDLNKSPAIIKRGTVAKPDTTFTVSDEHMMRIAKGDLNVQAAVLQGRLKVKGNIGMAMTLGKLMGKMGKKKKKKG